MLFDAIVLAVIVIFTIIGYFKGFISQFSTLTGIILAFVLSPKWTPLIQDIVRDLLPFSYVISDMFSRLFVGVVIFVGVKLIGKLFEFMFVNKVRELGAINRWGGFFFGFLKSVLTVFLIMTFVTLLPTSVIKKRFSQLETSSIFKISKKYNPIVNPQVMENLRKLSELSRDKRRAGVISNSATYRDYLNTKNLKDPLADDEAVDSFQRGDIANLKHKGWFSLLVDKDFMDFIHGERYYKQENTQAAPKEGGEKKPFK